MASKRDPTRKDLQIKFEPPDAALTFADEKAPAMKTLLKILPLIFVAVSAFAKDEVTNSVLTKENVIEVTVKTEGETLHRTFEFPTAVAEFEAIAFVFL